MPSANKLLSSALWYATHLGWHLFPVEPAGKKPLLKAWQKQATSMPETLRKWWAEWPSAGIGLATGEASGVWVLDVDCGPGKEGEKTMVAIQEAGGSLPVTVEGLTGGGGRHLFFSGPPWPKNSAGKIGQNLDVRGSGGYVVLPPSRHPSGQTYEWELSSRPDTVKVARAPAWLAALATGKPPPKTVAKGARNETLFKLACQLRRQGANLETLRRDLLELNAEICSPPLDNPEVLAIAASAAKYAPGKIKPRIHVTADLDAMATQAETALATSGKSGIYQRGEQLVRVLGGSTPAIVAIPEPALLASCCAEIAWIQVTHHGELEVRPPPDVIRILASRGRWQFPVLEGLIETPTIRPDGSLIRAAGYDPRSRLFLAGPLAGMELPDRPSRNEALKAVAALLDPLQDFAFGAPYFQSAMLAAILTPILRPSFDGSVPVFAFESSIQGAGKTKLADVAGIIATGRQLPRMSQTDDEREDRKRIAALLAAGSRIVFVDNIEHRFGSGTIGSLITSPVWDDRLLGSTAMGSWPNLSTWYLSGNNLSYHDDLMRRVIPIYIECSDENPEERSTFRYANLEAHVLANRPALVRAALTLIAAFHAAGAPRQPLTQYGSFEAWSDHIRHPLVWLGLQDPILARRHITQTSGSRVDQFGRLLALWRLAWGDAPKTIKEALDQATGDLAEAFLEVFPGRDPTRVDTLKLGYLFRSYRDRTIAGHRLRRTTQNNKAGVSYRVERVVGQNVAIKP